MLLPLWFILLTFNLYYAIILAGTFKGMISLFFCAISAYYIGQHFRQGR